MSKEFDISRCFSDGWDIYKSNMGLLILANLVAVLVAIFTFGILMGPLTVGLVLIVDRLIKKDSNKPVVGDIFKGMDKFAASFVCILLFVVIALIASVIPIIGQLASLVISPLLMYSLMYIAYEDLGAIDSVKKTIQGLVSGKMLMPVILGVLAGLVGGMGAMLCGVGAIFTAPFGVVLYVCAYHQMQEGDDITDAEVIDPQPVETPPVPPADPIQKKVSEEDADIVDPNAAEPQSNLL